MTKMEEMGAGAGGARTYYENIFYIERKKTSTNVQIHRCRTEARRGRQFLIVTFGSIMATFVQYEPLQPTFLKIPYLLDCVVQFG